MILPNLFIAGAAKSGTSALHEYLNRHPEIYMSDTKEPHHFAHDKKFSKGLYEYSKLFEPGRDCQIRGESSTGYMVFPNVVERIKLCISHPKFIFVLRNPLDRAYSHYWWLKGMGYEKEPFREAFLSDMNQEPDPTRNKHGMYKFYYQYGCYAKWLTRFIETFGQDAILILTTEDLLNNKLATLNACCFFLEVAPFERIDDIQRNETLILRHAWIYQWIMYFFLSPKFWRFLTFIFPSNNSRIKNKAYRKLSASLKSILAAKNKYPKINEEDRAWVASFYTDEVNMLRTLTGMKFELWTRDFP